MWVRGSTSGLKGRKRTTQRQERGVFGVRGEGVGVRQCRQEVQLCVDVEIIGVIRVLQQGGGEDGGDIGRLANLVVELCHDGFCLLDADADAGLFHGVAGHAERVHELLVKLTGAERVELLIKQGDPVPELFEAGDVTPALLQAEASGVRVPRVTAAKGLAGETGAVGVDLAFLCGEIGAARLEVFLCVGDIAVIVDIRDEAGTGSEVELCHDLVEAIHPPRAGRGRHLKYPAGGGIKRTRHGGGTP